MSESKSVASACVPCVPPNALVITNPSISEIQDIAVGDKILDAHGNYSIVTKIWQREFNGEFVAITLPYQQDEVLLTPEHPVLAVRGHKCRHSEARKLCFPKDNPRCKTCNEKRIYEPEFVAAGELSALGTRNSYVKHMLIMPRLKVVEDIDELSMSKVAGIGYEDIGGGFVKPRKENAHNRGRTAVAVKEKIKIDNDFMALVGYYLAEGSVIFEARGCQIRFDFGSKEENYVSKVVQLLRSVFSVNAYEPIREKSVIRVCISSNLIGHFFVNLFGKGASKKHLPRWMLTLPIGKQEAMLRAYWQGDGYQWMNVEQTQMMLSVSTVSRKLAYGLHLLLHRFGVIHNIARRKVTPSAINGRQIKAGYSYQIQVYPPSSIRLAEMIGYPVPKAWRFLQSHQMGIDDNWIYLPIKKIERRPYHGVVMNLTTEPDNTYTVSGVAVHNCALGHFSTSARLLNEAVRFKKDGLTNPQILDDIAAALGEQNALERIDLTPEKIRTLPEWEKEMANLALETSRELRHKLESIQSMEELENLAADTEEFYKKLNREWTTKRLEECPTCNIKPQEEQKLDKPNLDQYGKTVAQRRRELLDEIRAGIGS